MEIDVEGSGNGQDWWNRIFEILLSSVKTVSFSAPSAKYTELAYRDIVINTRPRCLQTSRSGGGGIGALASDRG